MYWFVLLLGIALWWAAHLFKRVAPTQRANLGERGKGIVAIGIALSILLMWFGYRNLDYVALWSPPGFMVHINNLLMLIAIYLMSPAAKRGKLLAGMRHPMLTGFSLWAIGHLMVNGDWASVLLFGGLLIWAVASVRIINSAEPEWAARTDGTYAKDGMFLAASAVLLAVIGFIHGWLGPWPFPG